MKGEAAMRGRNWFCQTAILLALLAYFGATARAQNPAPVPPSSTPPPAPPVPVNNIPAPPQSPPAPIGNLAPSPSSTAQPFPGPALPTLPAPTPLTPAEPTTTPQQTPDDSQPKTPSLDMPAIGGFSPFMNPLLGHAIIR